MARKKGQTKGMPRTASERRVAEAANHQRVKFLRRHVLNGRPFEKGATAAFDRWVTRTLVARGIAELAESPRREPPSRKQESPEDGSILIHQLAKELDVKSSEIVAFCVEASGEESFAATSKLSREQADVVRAAVAKAAAEQE